jgi:hypothetical protein
MSDGCLEFYYTIFQPLLVFELYYYKNIALKLFQTSQQHTFGSIKYIYNNKVSDFFVLASRYQVVFKDLVTHDRE